MRLSILHECTTTGAIAAGPMVPAFNSPKKKKKKKINEAEDNTKIGYLGISTQKQPTNKMDNVWTVFKPTKSKPSITAAKSNPDERLLKQFRGKGL